MAKAKIHQKIIDTASELFYANGYNATGINEIIAKSEIAKATLYSHFKSKEAICIAYLEKRHTDFMGNLKPFVASKESGRPQLLAIFDFLRTHYLEGNFHGCWAIKTLEELPNNNNTIAALIQKHKKELLLFLGELVGDNLPNVSKADMEKISGGLYLLYESAITESYLHGNDWPIHMARSIAPSLFQDKNIV